MRRERERAENKAAMEQAEREKRARENALEEEKHRQRIEKESLDQLNKDPRALKIQEGLERTDTQTYKVMGQTGFDKETVNAMSDEDFAAYLYAENEKDFFEFTNSQRQQLVASGLTPAQIIHLRKGILEYGVDEVLNAEAGMSEEQKNLVRDILTKGGEDIDNPFK